MVFRTSFARFRQRYAEMGGYGGHEIKGYQNQEEMNERFYSIAYRATKDVIDLPEEVHSYKTCQLSAAAMKAYNTVDKGFVAEVGKGQLTVDNALTKLLRLRQITGGHVPDDDGNMVTVDDAKEKLLEDILEDVDPSEPVVVFCEFVEELAAVRRVAERLGRRYGEISGARKDLTKDSTMPDNVDVIGVQMRAGGVGIDLTRARYCLYFSVGYSLGDYEQSLARVHRPGQTRTVYFIHLIAECTVDTVVYNALRKRKDVVTYVLDQIKANGKTEEEVEELAS
jgi:SNF2 family DNA or RNA helicase